MLGFVMLALVAAAPASTDPTAATATPTATTEPSPSDGAPGWIHGIRPQRNLWEVGTFGGVLFPHHVHDLYDLDTLPHQRLAVASPSAGLRAAYFPLSFLGGELEYMGAWSHVRAGGEPAFVYGLRGHVIARLPLYRIAPFILGGYGALGVRSTLDAVGSDIDPEGHWGLGAELFALRHLAVRLDGRHVMSAASRQKNVVASHLEIHLGISVPLGWWSNVREPR